MCLSHLLQRRSRWLLSRSLLPLLLLWGATAAAGELTPAARREAATDFSLSKLQGGQQSLAELRGKVVVINFWSTDFGPCRGALTYLSNLQQRFTAQNLVVLAVNIDGARDRSKVRSFMRRLRLNMPILLDTERRVAAHLNPRGSVPYTLLIDRSGRIAGSHRGPDGPSQGQQIRAQIETLLAEPAPGR